MDSVNRCNYGNTQIIVNKQIITRLILFYANTVIERTKPTIVINAAFWLYNSIGNVFKALQQFLWDFVYLIVLFAVY